MKTKAILICLTLVSSGVVAQTWDTTTPGIAYHPGKVGINNTNPQTHLDIKTAGSPQLYLSTSRTFSTSRNWGLATNWEAEGDFSILESTTNTAVPLVARFLINVAGHVGINNTAPRTLLDIKTSAGPQLYLSTSRTFSTSRNWGLATNWEAEGDFAILESTTNADVPLATRFLINVAGNVGINNIAPRALLDIKTGGGPQLYLSTNRTFSTSRHWGIATNWNAEGDFSILESTTNADVPILTRLAIDVNGNVGIGTATPDSKLTVAGNVHSREVTVTINAGSDFVFEDNYDLLPLTEVERFIQQNKHLPDIEPAKEMEEKGVELGKMDMKLLQKIEELTLYMIDFKKEIEALKEENMRLKNEITALKKN